MALRHLFPDFEVNFDACRVEPSRVVPKAPQPVTLIMAKPEDAPGMVAQIVKERYVAVEAGTGVGKSTLLPRMIAEQSGKVVVFTVPSDKLAWAQYEYAKFSHPKSSVQYVAGVDEELITSGVIYMSTSTCVARFIAKGSGVPADFVLFMDEWHESDGASYALRTVGMNLPVVSTLVMASATAKPVNFMPSATRQRVSVKKFHERRLDQWDLSDANVPWHPDMISENTLIFLDDDKAVRRLTAGYVEAGLAVFRLTARSSLRDMQEVILYLQRPQQQVAVIFVDYSYRSGFTFNLGVVIDSGYVRYNVSAGGRAVQEYRQAYVGEREQAVARVGRIAGSSAIAWVPDYEPEWKICNLEGVESDAAALLMRYLGFRPPADFAGSCMREGLVPRGLAGVLAGSRPLRDYPESYLGRWPGDGELDKGKARAVDISHDFTATVSQASASVDNEEVAFESVTKTSKPTDAGDESALPLVADRSDDLSLRQETVVGVDFEKTLREFMYPGSRDLEYGKCYYSAGVGSGETSTNFPRGLESVLAMAARSDFVAMAAGLSPENRRFAVARLLEAYNENMVRAVSVRRLFSQLPQMRDRMVTASNVHVVKDWVVELVESVTANGAILNELTRTLNVLRPGGGYEDMELDAGLEKVAMTAFIQDLQKRMVAPQVDSQTVAKSALEAKLSVVRDTGPRFLQDSTGTSPFDWGRAMPDSADSPVKGALSRHGRVGSGSYTYRCVTYRPGLRETMVKSLFKLLEAKKAEG